jgi:4-hydroxy-tetrahydrodipicolinate synthase
MVNADNVDATPSSRAGAKGKRRGRRFYDGRQLKTMTTTIDWKTHPWAGVFPATLCAFRENEDIDEEGLRAYFRGLLAVPGVKGLVCNGHTGEIMSLAPEERARVTAILAEEVRGRAVNSEQWTVNSGQRAGRAQPTDHRLPITDHCRPKVVTGLAAEGSRVAIEQAKAAKDAGADAILLMPPHHWLRFGRSSAEAVGFIADVAEGADIDIIIHQYPAWTKAGYTLKEMLEMVKIPRVVCIKMGTRDMARWLWDYEQIKAARPDLPIITCHDEYLLPTLLEAGDGALIGFAGFAPELMIELVHACLEGDLPRAKKAQRTVAPLARLIYNFGEPGCGAHQRMKVAKWLLGGISSPVFRRPVRPLPQAEVQRLREGLQALGLKTNG